MSEESDGAPFLEDDPPIPTAVGDENPQKIVGPLRSELQDMDEWIPPRKKYPLSQSKSVPFGTPRRDAWGEWKKVVVKRSSTPVTWQHDA